jgi:hypothetical protein
MYKWFAAKTKKKRELKKCGDHAEKRYNKRAANK